MSRMSIELFDRIIDELEVVQRSIFPLISYSDEIKHASDRVQDAIDIMKRSVGDYNVPIRSLKRNINDAIIDLEDYLKLMDSHNTNDNKVDDIIFRLFDLVDMIQNRQILMP